MFKFKKPIKKDSSNKQIKNMSDLIIGHSHNKSFLHELENKSINELVNFILDGDISKRMLVELISNETIMKNPVLVFGLNEWALALGEFNLDEVHSLKNKKDILFIKNYDKKQYINYNSNWYLINFYECKVG